jgi:hypothetical protein
MLIIAAAMPLGPSAPPSRAGGDGADSLVAGAEMFARLRTSNLKGDGAMAGDFLARPGWIDETHVEYKAEVRAEGTGDYDLKAVPGPATAPPPGAPREEEYPTMRAAVRQGAGARSSGLGARRRQPAPARHAVPTLRRGRGPDGVACRPRPSSPA